MTEPSKTNPMVWRSIETAPNDGTWVIFLGRYGKAVVARWGDLNIADSEFGKVAHEPRWCWITEFDGKNDPTFVRMDWLEPTHWMPLPSPPEPADLPSEGSSKPIPTQTADEEEG